jgi:hypothetical protein
MRPDPSWLDARPIPEQHGEIKNKIPNLIGSHLIIRRVSGRAMTVLFAGSSRTGLIYADVFS